MKRKPNYLKHILQWGVLAAIAGTVLWANFSEKPVDVEAYCPFGGLQAFGTYLVNNSLACNPPKGQYASTSTGLSLNLAQSTVPAMAASTPHCSRCFK